MNQHIPFFNLRVFIALMRKDMRIAFANLPGLILDCLFPALAQVLMFGYLFPLLGMPINMVGPIYLGSIMPLFFQLGYSLTMHMGFDMESNRFIDYQLTLPISKPWLFATYITSNMVETGLAIAPLLALGIVLLPAHFVIAHINWLALAVIFPLILLFFSTFFLVIAYRYSFWWIRSNFWPRRMLPLFFLSAGLVTWNKVFIFWPSLAYAMLLSPITYVTEGLRVTLLGGPDYIPALYCIGGLSIFIAINCVLLATGIRTKLDPV